MDNVDVSARLQHDARPAVSSEKSVYRRRRESLAAVVAEEGLDAVLVTHLPNIRYLTGFTGSNAAVLVEVTGEAHIATDGRYATQIADEVPDIPASIVRPCGVGLLQRWGKRPVRVGAESHQLSLAEWREFAGIGGVDVVETTGLVERLRLIKDDQEIAALRAVADVANQSWREILVEGVIREGLREIDVAADLEYAMRRRGAERTSFDTIVASGPNSAKPHHGAGERVLRAGDLVTVDFGAYLAGYNSDMTRTVVVGQADEWTAALYDVVLRSHRAGIATATVGTSLQDVDAACRNLIAEEGFGDYFVHSTGHGVGLDVHEAPLVSATGRGTVQEHMTLTIEPGIYVPGRGGVRIEDTLVITSSGPVSLSDNDKELRLV